MPRRRVVGQQFALKAGVVFAERRIISVSPNKIVAWSPIAQAPTVYNPTYQNRSFTHQPSPIPVDQVINDANSQFLAQGADAFVDSMVGVQGPLVDTYQIRTWAAAESPIAPLLVVIIFAVIAVAISAALIVGWLVGSATLLELAKKFFGEEPRWYNEEDPEHPFTTWSEFISAQNAKYWYVCYKDGAGFGEKALYPTPADVPPEIVELYEAHCAQAPDISAPVGPQLGNMILFVVFILGGVFIVMWGLGKVFGKGGAGAVVLEKAKVPGVFG